MAKASESKHWKRVTAGSLIDLLKQVPAETPIVLSSDPEGNEFYFPWTESVQYDDQAKRVYIFPVEYAEEPEI